MPKPSNHPYALCAMRQSRSRLSRAVVRACDHVIVCTCRVEVWGGGRKEGRREKEKAKEREGGREEGEREIGRKKDAHEEERERGKKGEGGR